MKDEDKTKEQLIVELAALRRQAMEGEKYRDLFESVPVGIFRISPEGRFLEANTRTAEILGYETAADLINSITDVGTQVYRHAEDRHELLRLLMTQGYVQNFEGEFVKKNGDSAWGSMSVKVVRDAKGNILYHEGITQDITELKLAQEKFKASQKQFRGLLESIPIGVVTIEGTRFGYVNAAFEKITGYTRDELRRIDVWDMMHPEFKDEVRQYLQKHHKRLPIPEVFALKIITKTGEERWVERRAIPITVNERPLVLLTAIDITDRKESEEKLKASEMRFRNFVELIPIGILTYEGSKFRYANLAFEEITGYTRDELYRMDVWDIVHPEFKDIVRGYVLRQQDGEPVPKLYVVKIITKNGEIRWVERRGFPIEVSEKPIVLLTVTDVTEAKSAEEALIQSEQKYRALLENAGDAIILADETGEITEVNRKAEDLLGYTREELLQMNYTQLHPTKELDRTSDAFKKTVENGYGTLKDGLIIRKDSMTVPVDITGSVIQHVGKKVFQGLFRDITEHKNIKHTLANLVSERTAELSEKNERLMMEMKERERVEASLRKRRDELRLRAGELKELNSALRVLLKQRDEDKRDLEDKVMANIRQLVIPYVEGLKKSRLDARSKTQVGILETNLTNITSSFTHRLSSKYSGFTPREIQVANLIRQGKSTKDMAEYLRVSPSAINLYRSKIRQKLGIISKKINLRSHLMSLS